MKQKGIAPLGILIIITVLVIGGIAISSRQPNPASLPAVSPIQVSPSPTTQPIVKATSNPTPKLTATPLPTNKPTTDPSNIPVSTPNPCRMGKPASVIPDSSVRLDSVLPTSGKVGDIIIIKGSGFGKSSFYYPDPTKFLGGVSFYGTLCGYNSGGAPLACTQDWDYSCWSETELKIKVPGVSTGGFQIEVMSSDGKRSNRLDFQVLQ